MDDVCVGEYCYPEPTFGTWGDEEPVIVPPTWTYIFQDAKRGTELRINTDTKTFQFVAPEYDSGIKTDPEMKVRDSHWGQSIRIRYMDSEIWLFATAFDAEKDFCVASLWDRETRTLYKLRDKLGVE